MNGLRISSGNCIDTWFLIVMLGLVLIPSAARRAAVADSIQEATTEQTTGDNSESTADSKPAIDGKPSNEVPDQITTVGHENVEPIEFSGQVLDVTGNPASGSKVLLEGTSPESLRIWTASINTNAEGQFRVRIRVKKEQLPQLRVSAVSADQSQLGFYRFPWNQEVPPESIILQLAPARTVKLKVMDESGAPIENAQTAVQLPSPHTADVTATNKDGVAEFLIAANERIQAVVAWKDHAGLDYRLYDLSRRQKADAITKAPEFPDNGVETLILEGASPVIVKLTDDDDQPLADAGVYPWLLKKESENDYLNLSMFNTAFLQNTGADGTTTFAWLPSWQSGPITFWPSIKGFVHQRGSYTPGTEDSRLEIVLNRLVPIRGRVRNADGTLAAGIHVTATGRGYAFDGGRRVAAITDETGAYEVLVPPDQIYLIVASGKELAAAPQTGFAVFKGQPVEGKDFTLRRATRVYGKLLDEATQEPIANERVFVYQYGQDLHSMDGVVLPNPENSRSYVRPLTAYNTLTNEQGQFELFVGDGNFDIRPPRQEKSEKFEIAGESQREFLVTTKLSKQVELAGTVRTEATGELLPNVRVSSVSRSHGGRDWQATTNQAGEFRVQQYPAATYIHAISADKTLGAIVEVESNRLSVPLMLQPLGMAKGRLLTTDTKEPWGGQVILYGVRVPDENDQTWSNRFGGRVTTARDGTFELGTLVPNWKYEMQMEPRSDGTIPSVGDVMVKPGESISIGDVSAPPPRKPYVPPTLEERIADAFDVSGTAIERHAKALDLIGLVKQHLLIVFGVPEDPRIHRLMEIRYSDADFRPFSDEFRFMAIPTDEERKPESSKLASILNESLDGERSSFLLVLLDSTGTKVATANGDDLSVEGKLSRDRLFEWLREHQPDRRDARKLLDDALAEARQQNKRVLVQETATWCGPCHMLSRFLKANPVWEKDYVWLKMDHRYNGARELMAELRDGAEGGIPWFVILDADGEKLATSNDQVTKRNVGYPSETSGQKHFEHMLKLTRQRLTDEEIAELIAKLKGAKE
ncbi:MAG TPA: thioredoxin family protein [Pirellulaceae bacterium]|nr:thioredoxin family protein [Pirellulaceae bacterium]